MGIIVGVIELGRGILKGGFFKQVPFSQGPAKSWKFLIFLYGLSEEEGISRIFDLRPPPRKSPAAAEQVRADRHTQACPPRRTPRWAKHTQDVTNDDHKSGILVTIKGWKCLYCSRSFWNSNVKRLLAHLSGDRDACVAAMLCSEEKNPIAEATKAECKATLTMKGKTANAKRARADESLGAEATDDRERACLVQSRVKSKMVEACEVDGALSDLFDGLGMAHAKLDHPLFKRFWMLTKYKNAACSG
jgi:hypothetical protein